MRKKDGNDNGVRHIDQLMESWLVKTGDKAKPKLVKTADSDLTNTSFPCGKIEKSQSRQAKNMQNLNDIKLIGAPKSKNKQRSPNVKKRPFDADNLHNAIKILNI